MAQDANPLISIVMAAYNCKDYIAQAIESIKKQTYSNWELLITDDYSSDSTYDIALEASQKDNRIKVFKNEQNKGTAYTRNNSLKHVSGQYLCFLDSDDMIDTTFLEEQLAILINNPNSVAVTSAYRITNGKRFKNSIPYENITYRRILKWNPIGLLSTLINLNISGIRYFDESLSKCEDYYYWINLIKEFGPVIGNKKILATYRLHLNNKSGNKIGLVKWQMEVYKRCQVPYLFRYYYLLRWMFHGLVKYRKFKHQ